MAQNIKGITYKDYNERLRLPEQAHAEKMMLKQKHFVLAFDPGAGKSMPVIHCIREIDKMKNGNASLLIMSDATCIKEMWKTEIAPMDVLPKETFMVTDRTAIGAVKDAIVKKKWDIIVIDEAQSLRSGVTRAKSQYAKLVYQLCSKAEYVFGMTGTIAGNNNIEPFCVLHAMHVGGLGKINCRSFKKTFCINELQYGPFGAFEKPVRLNTQGEELMNRTYKDNVLFWDYLSDNEEMPPMDIIVEKFQVPETETYKNALDGILQCGEHESTVLKAIAMQKAQQALNGFVYYSEEAVRNTYQVPQFNNPKLDYIVKTCKNSLKIVSYRFQEDGHYIVKALEVAGIKTTNKIKEFKEIAATGQFITLVIQCSRGKAANIQICQDIIYYTSDFSFISYKQMIHRCWRRGQTKPCKVTFLVNHVGDGKLVEEKIYKALQAKQGIHDLLMSIKSEGGD